MKKLSFLSILFFSAILLFSCGGGSVKSGSFPDPGYYIQYTERSSEPWVTTKIYVYHDKMKTVISSRPGIYTLVIGDKMYDVNEQKKTYIDVTSFLVDRNNPAKGLQGYMESVEKEKSAKLDFFRKMVLHYVFHESNIAGFKVKEYSAHDDTKTGDAMYLHLYICDLPELNALVDGISTNTSGLAKFIAMLRFYSHPQFGWLVASSFVDGFTKSWILDEIGELPLNDPFFSLDGFTESAGEQ